MSIVRSSNVIKRVLSNMLFFDLVLKAWRHDVLHFKVLFSLFFVLRMSEGAFVFTYIFFILEGE